MTSGLGHSKHRGLLVLLLNMRLNCKCAFSGAFQRARTRRFYLGVSVLAGLWGRHFNYLTGSFFEHDKAILPQRRALHGERIRGPGSTAFKVFHDGLEGGTEIDWVSKKRRQKNPINVFIHFFFKNNQNTAFQQEFSSTAEWSVICKAAVKYLNFWFIK